ADRLVRQHHVALPGLADHDLVVLHLDLAAAELPAEHLESIALVTDLERLGLDLRGVANVVHALTLPALAPRQKEPTKRRGPVTHAPGARSPHANRDASWGVPVAWGPQGDPG